jgi:formate dehydrogenase maturation protein FdhE
MAKRPLHIELVGSEEAFLELLEAVIREQRRTRKSQAREHLSALEGQLLEALGPEVPCG